MKTRTLTLVGASLTLVLALPAPAQNPATSDRAGTTRAEAVRLAPPDAKERAVRKLEGREVTGSDGAKLGRVEDLAFDAQSGKTYAIVGTGGVLGVGEKLRVVNFEPSATAAAATKAPLTVPMDRANWNQRPTIDARQLDDGQWSLSDEQWRALSDPADRAVASASRAVPTESAGDGQRRRVLVSLGELRGKALRVADREVGEIEAVIFEPAGRPAAVVDMDEDFAGSDRKLLVVLEQLQFGAGGREAVNTTLTQADFRRASGVAMAEEGEGGIRARTEERTVSSRSGTATATTDNSDRPAAIPATPGANDEALTPTGRSGGTSAQDVEVDPAIESTVRAIRQLWNAEPALRDLDLEVRNVAGRIVLSGTVKSEDERKRAREAAERLVSRIPLDNHILIKPE